MHRGPALQRHEAKKLPQVESLVQRRIAKEQGKTVRKQTRTATASRKRKKKPQDKVKSPIGITDKLGDMAKNIRKGTAQRKAKKRKK